MTLRGQDGMRTPMVKPRHLPCSADELRRARELPPYHSRSTAAANGESVLLLRIPRDAPDLVNDLDAALRLLPTKAANEAHHVVLVGDRDALTLSANTLRPLVRARDEREAVRMDAFRREAPFAFAWFRLPGDPHASTRLVVRVPVPRVGLLEDRDADAIAVAAGPALDLSADRGCLCVYLVADDDHARLAPAEFLAEIRQRWAAAKEKAERLARPTPEPDPEPEAVVEVPAAAPEVRARAEAASEKVFREFFDREVAKRAAPARRALPKMPSLFPPSRFVFAYSEVVEARPRAGTPSPAPKHAVAPAPAAPAPVAEPEPVATRPSPWDAVKGETKALLTKAGFEVLENVRFGGLEFAFAAAREGREPEKVVVLACDDLSPSLSRQVLAASRDLGVDACVVLAPRVSLEAERNLIATRVSVYHPASLSELSFG